MNPMAQAGIQALQQMTQMLAWDEGVSLADANSWIVYVDASRAFGKSFLFNSFREGVPGVYFLLSTPASARAQVQAMGLVFWSFFEVRVARRDAVFFKCRRVEGAGQSMSMNEGQTLTSVPAPWGIPEGILEEKCRPGYSREEVH